MACAIESTTSTPAADVETSLLHRLTNAIKKVIVSISRSFEQVRTLSFFVGPLSLNLYLRKKSIEPASRETDEPCSLQRLSSFGEYRVRYI